MCRDGYPVTAYVPRDRGPDLGGLIDVGLDAVGFLPVVGDAVDLGRAAYDATRWALTGDEGAGVQALLNLGAVVPFVGSVGKQASKHADDVVGLVAGAAWVERRAQDVAVSARAPDALSLARPVSRSATRNKVVWTRIEDLLGQGARDVRVNQQQVDRAGQRSESTDRTSNTHWVAVDTMRSSTFQALVEGKHTRSESWRMTRRGS